MSTERKVLMRTLRRIAAGLALAAALVTTVAGCDKKVPATVGYCSVISGSLPITGGTVIGQATMVCLRHPENFSVAAYVEFLHGTRWVTHHAAVSTQSPPAGSVRGITYRVRTECIKKTRVRVLLTIKATFGATRHVANVLYPGKLGKTTGNCDTTR